MQRAQPEPTEHHEVSILRNDLLQPQGPAPDAMRLATEEMLVESVTYPAFNVSNVMYFGDPLYGGQQGMVRLCWKEMRRPG